MKKFLTVCILTISVAALGQSAPNTSPADCTQGMFKALLDEDSGLMAKVLTDDAVIINYDGFVAETSLILEGISGGYVDIQTGSVSGITTRTYSDNAAVVMGNWRAKGSIQGASFDNEVVFSTTCIKTSSGWKIANAQFTVSR